MMGVIFSFSFLKMRYHVATLKLKHNCCRFVANRD